MQHTIFFTVYRLSTVAPSLTSQDLHATDRTSCSAELTPWHRDDRHQEAYYYASILRSPAGCGVLPQHSEISAHCSPLLKTRTPPDTACLSTVNNTWNQVAMAVAVTRCHPVVCYRQEPRCQRIARPGSTQDCNVSSLPKHIAHSRPLPTRACSAHGYRRIGAPSASTSTHGVAHSRLQRTRVQSYRSKAVPSNAS